MRTHPKTCGVCGPAFCKHKEQSSDCQTTFKGVYPSPRVIDVRAEFSTAVNAFDKGSLNALVNRYGVPSKTRFYLPGSAIGFARIETDGDLYQPADEGQGALVMATAIMTGGEFEDLIAFRPSDPDRWFLRTGMGRWLGEFEIGRRLVTAPVHIDPPALLSPGRTDDELHIFATPMDWLRNNADGACPLVPSAVGDLLHVQTPIAYDSLKHRRLIEKQMTFQGALPKAYLRVMSEGAAA